MTPDEIRCYKGVLEFTDEEEIFMKYDFTTIMDRKGKDAIAVDVIPEPGGKVK